MNAIDPVSPIFLIMGITLIIVGIIFLALFFQLRKNKDKYIDYANQFPIYHWKFLSRRYLIEILIGLVFFLLTLGVSMLIVFFF